MRNDFSVHVNDLSREEWDGFVAAHEGGHLLQSWGWGDFKAQFGWQPLRVGLAQSGRLVAVVQALLRRLPVGKIAYAPKGPVLDRQDDSTAERLLSATHRALRQAGAILLKVEPDWPETGETSAWLQKRGFHQSAQTIQPRHTILVELGRSEEAILDGMKSKWRYNARLAERKGVQVREGGGADLERFYSLMQLTEERDEFAVHSREYYEQVWREFAPRGQARLLLAEHEGQTLAGIMVFAFGRGAWYMYGASANEKRHLMPNHLLQWEAMRWGKRQGCQSYDLWGIPDLDIETLETAVQAEKTPAPPPALWGVYKFKRGFGGQPVRYVGAWDYVYRPLLYRLLAWMWQRRRGAARGDTGTGD
jgi:lipid II:glycine glycyltransferase (peptidoglycan interpeptide bridge formation enzyme)